MLDSFRHSGSRLATLAGSGALALRDRLPAAGRRQQRGRVDRDQSLSRIRPSPGGRQAFHVAFFGSETRCELLGVENSLQIFRNDPKVAADAFAWHAGNHPADPPLEYCGKQYGDICSEMYWPAFRHSLFRCVMGVPRTLAIIISGGPDHLNWTGPTNPTPELSRWLAPGMRPQDYVLGVMFLIGCFGLCWRSVDRVGVGIVLGFLIYYSTIWFCVDPMQRHTGAHASCRCASWAVSRSPVFERIAADLSSGDFRSWINSGPRLANGLQDRHLCGDCLELDLWTVVPGVGRRANRIPPEYLGTNIARDGHLRCDQTSPLLHDHG